MHVTTPNTGRYALPLFAAVSILLSWASDTARSAPPVITSLPTVNATTLVANAITRYTVTLTVSDADGYADILAIHVLFNYTESGGDPALGRGFMVWGQADSNITRYGGTWTLAAATSGGGRWGYRTDQWGTATYARAILCDTTVSGSAAGGPGARTVTFTFAARQAWAANPIMNDADAFAEDATANTGWVDAPSSFDVVAKACTSTAATPRAPVLSNVGPNGTDLAIDPADSATDLFLVSVSPAPDTGPFVQANGSLGRTQVWRSRSAWGSTRVTGLASETTYSFSARAIGTASGACPSTGFGPAASATTLVQYRAIDLANPGRFIHRGIIGLASRLDGYNDSMVDATQRIWEIVGNTSIRGVAGGMDADTYNWKDMSGQGVGHTGTPGPLEATTLMWARNVRDYGASMPVVTVNTRGTGPLESSGWCRFYYTDTNVGPLAAMAADWVRYVNHILPAYRDGDALPASEQAIIDSINWYGRPKLLAAGESSTPRVDYWEIGNEPELTLPWCTPDRPTHTISPAEYASRYRQISAAMLAADPTIKVGPCTIGEVHSGAVLDDPAAQVDFVSYHPYGLLYGYAAMYGDTTQTAESGLRHIKQQQVERCNQVRNRIAASGRNPAAIQLIASEYNPSSWEWECSAQARRVAQALGLADTIFTFAELELLAAHYWSFPTICSATTEAPIYRVFQMLQQHLGDRLVDNFTDGRNLRLYTTLDSRTRQVAVWGLNFSETADKSVEFSLANLGPVRRVTLKRLAHIGGDTSLFDANLSPASVLVDWQEQTLTGVDPSHLSVTFEDATLTVIVIDRFPPVAADLDGDGDVDGADYGTFAACFAGTGNPFEPACAIADLNGDASVDGVDFGLFASCYNGTGNPPACTQQ